MSEQAVVVDLASSSSSDGVSDIFRAWFQVPPTPKASFSTGPGRGYGKSGRSGGKPRTYLDTETRNKMKQFTTLVREAVKQQNFRKLERDVAVTVTIWCFLKRPDEHFISRRRVAGRLKEESTAPAVTVVPVKPDIDNIAKFVLDAIKEVLFVDDAQIVELHMFKLRDTEGDCSGRVAIEVKKWDGSLTAMVPSF